MFAILLLGVVLALYYPALAVPLNPVDDHALVQWLYEAADLPVWTLFDHARDVFYRPVLLTTFFFDMRLWGAETSFLHLENILLHVFNVLLLFACARIIFARTLAGRVWPPFLAALLFAIHPINSEAVVWVSGRSDLLAASFMLLALYLLLRGLQANKPGYAWLSTLPLVLGALSKETAVFFIPAAIALVVCIPRPLPSEMDSGKERPRWHFFFPFLMLPLAYLVLRGLLAHDAGGNLVRQFFPVTAAGLAQAAITMTTGLGFYAKKLFIPWPLNFTIFQISAYYVWVGLPILVALIFSAWRRSVTGGLFLCSAALLFPALLAMVLRPAWTPVAERYLYMPAIFFVLGIVLAGFRIASKASLRPALLLFLLLFCASFAMTTVSRSLLWQDNLALFEDTVRKSPEFPFARSVLADLLIESGRGAEGAALVRENTAPAGLRNADFLDLKRAELLMKEGRYTEARDLIIKARRKEGQLYYEFQKMLVSVDLRLLNKLTGVERQGLLPEIVALYEELQRVTNDPFYYYRLGQLYLQEGDQQSAGRNFRLAALGAPEGSTYKKAAEKLSGKLAPP